MNRVASVADFAMVITPVKLALREDRKSRIGGCVFTYGDDCCKSGDFF